MRKLLSTLLATLVLLTSFVSLQVLPAANAAADINLLEAINGGNPIVIDDDVDKPFWNTNVSYNGDTHRYLHMSVKSDVPFQIAFSDTVTVSEKWITMTGDFYPAFGLTEGPADSLIPAGSYNVSLDLKGCYTWDNSYPADGMLNLSNAFFEPSGVGHFEVSHLSLSGDATFDPFTKDIDLLPYLNSDNSSSPIVIEDDVDKPFWETAIRYSGNTHPYLHMTVSSEVPFQIAFLDNETTGYDKWISVTGDFCYEFDLNSVPADNLIPAGTYHVSMYIKGCYTWDNSYPANGNLMIDGVFFEPSGVGHFEVSHLSLSSEAVYVPRSMGNLMDKSYVVEGLENISVNDAGEWIIKGRVALAPYYTFNYSVLPNLQLHAVSSVPYAVTICDNDPGDLYDNQWIDLYPNWAGESYFPAGTFNDTRSIQDIFNYKVTNEGWKNQNNEATVRAIYIEPQGEGTLTLKSLNLVGTDMESDGYNYYTTSSDFYYQRSPHNVHKVGTRAGLGYGTTPAQYKLFNRNTGDYVRVYCADFYTTARGEVNFRRLTLENSPLAHNAGFLRAVAKHAYLKKSLSDLIGDVVKTVDDAALKADLDNLTEEEALSACQAAMWEYSNGTNNSAKEFEYVRSVAFSRNSSKNFPAYSGYDTNMYGAKVATNVLAAGTKITSENHGVKTASDRRINAVYNYLMNLPADDTLPKQATVMTQETLNADGTVTVVFWASEANKDGSAVELQANVSGASVVGDVVELADGKRQVTLSGFSGSEYSIWFYGSQDLGPQAYFYEADGGMKVAQSFIGVDEAPARVSESKTFKAPAKPTTTT
ncbi:MAG: Cys-Gln thioester bond-forming surface protein, partial [Clostridia bacterium]|nr:Cys-Gln thioester bond-forming surface protein [Clostridia bacterium]